MVCMVCMIHVVHNSKAVCPLKEHKFSTRQKCPTQNPMLHWDALFNVIAGCEDRGRAVCHRREPEAAGDLRGEGEEEGGEIPGSDFKYFWKGEKKERKKGGEILGSDFEYFWKGEKRERKKGEEILGSDFEYFWKGVKKDKRSLTGSRPDPAGEHIDIDFLRIINSSAISTSTSITCISITNISISITSISICKLSNVIMCRTRSSSWTSGWKSRTLGPSTPRWTSPSFTSGGTPPVTISLAVIVIRIIIPPAKPYPIAQDWRAGGRDHQGEVEDQRRLRAARRHFQRDAPQILDKDLWPVLWRHWIYVVTVVIFVETKYTKYSCSLDLSNHHHGETGVWTRYIVPASVFHLENNEPLVCKCLRSRTYFDPLLSGFFGVSLIALDF